MKREALFLTQTQFNEQTLICSLQDLSTLCVLHVTVYLQYYNVTGLVKVCKLYWLGEYANNSDDFELTRLVVCWIGLPNVTMLSFITGTASNITFALFANDTVTFIFTEIQEINVYLMKMIMSLSHVKKMNRPTSLRALKMTVTCVHLVLS